MNPPSARENVPQLLLFFFPPSVNLYVKVIVILRSLGVSGIRPGVGPGSTRGLATQMPGRSCVSRGTGVSLGAGDARWLQQAVVVPGCVDSRSKFSLV